MAFGGDLMGFTNGVLGWGVYVSDGFFFALRERVKTTKL
jgi:hypothetical protein